MELLKNYVPCICLNPKCRIHFQMLGPVSGGNVTIANCGTRCPNCGSNARIADGTMTPNGRYMINDLVEFVSSIQNPQVLKKVQGVLESANDEEYAEELIDSLSEIDPSFSKFKSAVHSLSSYKLVYLVDKLLVLISILIAYYAIVRSDDANRQNIELQEKQYELNQSQFEYQKQQDLKEDDLKKQIDELRNSIEKEISKPDKPSPENKNKIKGCDRNKPCPCGSGRKYKKCHPQGYVV